MIEQTFTGRTCANPDRFPAEVLRVYREAAALPGAKTAMINYYRALLRGGGMRRLTTRGFPVIDTPTLMLWGTEDPILVPSITDDADAWVRNLTRRFIPGAGHWVQQEAPETVNAMLEAWLEGKEVPEAASPAGNR